MALRRKTVNTLREDSSVADWLAANPARSRVFEVLGIDYCCGGKTSLREVCSQKGIELGEVISKLQMAEKDCRSAEHTNWADKEIWDLVDHIERVHHAYLRNELPRLSDLVAKVRHVHGERHPELLEIKEIYDCLKTDLESHMKKEESVLFPLIRQLWYVWAEAQTHPGGIQNPIRAMESEHEEAGRALQRLRRLSRNYTPPADACSTYRALMEGLEQLELDLHQHIHEENNILFPRVFETGFAVRPK
jgi:regulator of cell morphogenesis and NO signaling